MLVQNRISPLNCTENLRISETKPNCDRLVFRRLRVRSSGPSKHCCMKIGLEIISMAAVKLTDRLDCWLGHYTIKQTKQKTRLLIHCPFYFFQVGNLKTAVYAQTGLSRGKGQGWLVHSVGKGCIFAVDHSTVAFLKNKQCILNEHFLETQSNIIDWLIDWFKYHWLIDWLIHSFIHFFIHPSRPSIHPSEREREREREIDSCMAKRNSNALPFVNDHTYCFVVSCFVVIRKCARERESERYHFKNK